MEQMKVIRRFPSGVVTPPPSKSLAHRALICAALAAQTGDSVVENFALSDDVEATLSGIETFGCRWKLTGRKLHVYWGGNATSRLVDSVESGSTLRMLLPVAALSEQETAFMGRGRLMERPLDVYRSVFPKAGVEFYRNGSNVYVRGPLRGGVYEVPGNVSSQFVSGLLFALPLCGEDSELHVCLPFESKPYVDLTVSVMAHFGVQVSSPEEGCYLIKGGQKYRPALFRVEPDYSQAAYFLGAGALGCDVACDGLNPDSLQGDRAILDVLKEMGAQVVADNGRLSAKAGPLRAVTVDARQIPDLVPPIATLCCFCAGTSRIENAARLRLKESDRLQTMTQELRSLGGQIVEGPDYLEITGTSTLRGGVADAHNDHRVAMSMALASIRCEKPVQLTGASCVNKSYPDFWQEFEKEERLHG